jgi:pilus assembly protein Flp/PilA
MLGHVRKDFSRARTRVDDGASAVEYGLMVAAIAALIVGVVFALGGLVKATFDKTCSAISEPTQSTCVPDAKSAA